eukprot:14892-Heterococcus_DN1.PRE.3
MHTTTATAATNNIYCYPICLMFAAAVMYRTDNDGFIAIDDLEMIVGGDHTSEEVKEAIRHFDKCNTGSLLCSTSQSAALQYYLLESFNDEL